MSDIKISIYCCAYNCANFIEKSINGMLSQKISVDYKIIIHDDASTDGTADIIRRYAALYPEIIYAVLQSENQYSKGANIYKQFIEPNIEGEYIAICEGDDYWIDENKLQMQYNYMEKHPECSLCTHNTIRYDLDTGKKEKFNQWNVIHILTEDEVFMKWCVHTSSYFIRKNCRDWAGKYYWFGDYVMLTWAFYRGQVVSLPQLMSVYNAKNPNGVMSDLTRLDIKDWIKKTRCEIQYIKEYDVATNFKFNKNVQERIESIDYLCVKKESDYIILHSGSKEDSINAAKRMKVHPHYIKYVSKQKGIKKIMIKYKYGGYYFYPLWKLSMKIYLKFRM